MPNWYSKLAFHKHIFHLEIKLERKKYTLALHFLNYVTYIEYSDSSFDKLNVFSNPPFGYCTAQWVSQQKLLLAEDDRFTAAGMSPQSATQDELYDFDKNELCMSSVSWGPRKVSGEPRCCL